MFTVTVSLTDHSEMTGEDVARAMQQVADIIEQQDEQGGTVVDGDGNTIGTWKQGRA